MVVKPVNLLIIDDDPSILAMIKKKLELENYSVETAGSGKEGLSVISEKNIDLAIVDYLMPEMDGFETMEKIKELKPDLPVVMLTAHGSTHVATCAMKRQASDFVEKPVDCRQLMLTIEEVLREAKYRIIENNNKKLEEMNRSLGALVAGVGHNMNSILSSILGYTEIAMDELVDESAARAPLHMVITAVKRGRDMFLEMVMAGDKHLQRKPMNLKAEIDSILDKVESTVPDNIHVERELPAGKSVINGVQPQIHYMLEQLCCNSIGAMEKTGGTLTVCLSEKTVYFGSEDPVPGLLPGIYHMLTVKDTGCGLEPLAQSRIFEPFYATGDIGKGAGLGLFVVNRIVKNHGGEIFVESMPGQGSYFYVYLPKVGMGADDMSPGHDIRNCFGTGKVQNG